MGQERENFLVQTEGLLINLHGKGVILQPHERGKGVSVPQIDRVHAILDQHIEVLHPQLLIIEPREGLGRVGIFVDRAPGQVVGLLHTDAGASQHHLGGILEVRRSGQLAGSLRAVNHLTATIEQAVAIFTRHTNRRSLRLDAESLLLQVGRRVECQDNRSCTPLINHLIALSRQGRSQMFGSKQGLLGRLFGHDNLNARLRAGTHEYEGQEQQYRFQFHPYSNVSSG